MSTYISYMGMDELNGGDLDLSSLSADEVTVRGDINVTGLVDGVDISTLNAEVKNHDERISTIEDKLEHIQLDFVDLTSYQVITGNKVFDSNLTYFSNPRDDSVVVDGGIKTRVLTTTSDGTSSFQGPTTFYQDIDVKQNIVMPDQATVDGVDVSALNLEVKSLGAKINNMPTDYVDIKSAQTIAGYKTFGAGLTSRDVITVNGTNVVVNPIVSNRQGTVRTGVGIAADNNMGGGVNDAELILAGAKSTVMFNNHNFSENKNMNYDITCDGNKRLLINRGKAFGAGSNMMTFYGDVNTIVAFVDDFKVANNFYAEGKSILKEVEANGNIVMQPGKTVDGVDVSELNTRVVTLENKDFKNFVTLNTDQNIDGKKTFTQPTTIRSYAGNGLIASGMGVRNPGRAQMMMLSDGDGIAELYFGSELDGKGISDYNNKWSISSRDRANGKLIFYRCPQYTNGPPDGQPGTGGFEEVMSLQNVRDTWNGDYAVINMEKRVNIRGGMTVSDSDFFEYKLGIGADPAYNDYMYIQIQRVANTVTMTVNIPQSRVLPNAASILSATALPAKYRPSSGDVGFLASLATSGTFNYRTVLAAVTGGGVITIWAQMNPSSGTFGTNDVRINSFTVTWVTGLNPP